MDKKLILECNLADIKLLSKYISGHADCLLRFTEQLDDEHRNSFSETLNKILECSNKQQFLFDELNKKLSNGEI